MRNAVTQTGSSTTGEHDVKQLRLVWVELIKAIALIWIFLNHVVERLFGYPYIANPFAGWPSLQERLAQLYPVAGFGVWNVPLNLLRYLGWAGDQGVNLFLILSGFGLTWGLLARYGKAPLALGPFYRRRAGRVYPLWWGAHLLFIALWLLTGLGLSATNPATYLSMLGIRFTPELLYYFSPAWWYIGLLLQLYLVFPLLWWALRRFGPLWLLIISCAIAFSARALGLLVFDYYLDAWLRGAIFITRLPEFVFGISLAAWLYYARDRTDVRLRKPSTLFLALALYILGTALSLTLLGMTIAPFLLGVGLFVLLYAALARIGQPVSGGVGLGMWVGRHSYSLYLLHHPLILLLIPVGLVASSQRVLAGVVAAVLLTVAGAIALERSVGGTLAILGRWRSKVGVVRTAVRVVAIGLTIVVVLVGSELAIRWAAPQEVFGWGERPSLEPHPTFGWRLKASYETRLRWESYDYYVNANELGFPGPNYSEQKGADTLRIMTVGDAFTSAEGVDTTQAWPRLLETELAAQLPDQKVEVQNFAITGYGPNQYAAVVKTFAPVFQPDLILIGFFVNEYQDVQLSDEEFRHSIGFDLPAQNGWYAILRLQHLQGFLRLRLIEPLRELFLGQPNPHGYFLGNFSAMERDRADIETIGRQLVAERLGQIKAVADEVGAQVIVAMIPAPVQVCGPEELAYYPKHVDLANSTVFDLEQPQRETQKMTEALDLVYYDLRPALNSVPEGCPYQPRNMHWTAAGHRAVASYLTELLVTDRAALLVKEP